ncbi:DUF362 domain-containing protein [Candidatus Korobacter versatilis]|nr:DUF362 domain-containing protein [Candidatus Koribacter versatilis]
MNRYGQHNAEPKVAIHRSSGQVRYPKLPPFHPSDQYPELAVGLPIGTEQNSVYDAVRESFRLLGLDSANFGMAAWNPLSSLIQPGDHVFLKPNMIAHKHQLTDEWEHVITHGSVIRAVVDYAYLALQGKGQITLGDAPQTDSKFELIIERMGLKAIQELYAKTQNFEIAMVDLRKEHWIERDGIYVETVPLDGDPAGSIQVSLNNDSLFSELDGKGKTYYGAHYNVPETNSHHCDGKHEYLISRSPVSADVFISIPKLKTHKKCGITLNLKGLVGINADKNWLPHYVLGSPGAGGDQFDRDSSKQKLENSLVLKAKSFLVKGNPVVRYISRKTKRAAYRIFGNNENVVRSGNWHGNDTVWRMSLDLNRILLYANPDGSMRSTDSPKRYFSVVDGFIAMEGNGPVAGTAKECGVVIAGGDPVAVDDVCTQLMGFDFEKLLLIRRAFESHRYPLTIASHHSIRTCSNLADWTGKLVEWPHQSLYEFRPHFGWLGKVELERDAVAGMPT